MEDVSFSSEYAGFFYKNDIVRAYSKINGPSQFFNAEWGQSVSTINPWEQKNRKKKSWNIIKCDPKCLIQKIYNV